ncbi:MAG: metallophosphoesterase [Oscillospiraceae bacterium]|nr:metallophosphoesterase [Oscillospiraceae bacterium]
MKKRLLSLALALLLALPVAALCSVTTQAAVAPMELQFRPDHSFKIVVFADIHAGVSVAAKTKQFMHAVLRTEQPDLVVLTGDNIFGTGSVANSRTAIREVMDVLKPFGIPVAPVFGNHDAEGLAASQCMQVGYYNEYDFSLMRSESNTNEAGNYNLLIKSADGANPRAFNLWLLEARTFGGWYSVGAKTQAWMKAKNESLKTANGGVLVPSMVFKHIVPTKIRDFLAEECGGRASWQNYNTSTWGNLTNTPANELNVMGEDPCPDENDSGEWAAYKAVGTLAVAFGHEHANNFRLRWDGVDLINCGQASTGDNKARVLTIYEDRPNLSPDDIETRTVLYSELLAAGELVPLEDILPNEPITVYRKSQCQALLDAAEAHPGLTWRSSDPCVLGVGDDGALQYRFAKIGKATIEAYRDGDILDSVEVEVKWQWWQWLLVVVLFGWSYL